MKKRIIAIILAPVGGALLGYLLAATMNNGWFGSKWQLIEQPPGEEVRLVALSRDSLWVQAGSGTFYFNERAATCETQCWTEVAEIPPLPIVEPAEATVTAESCVPVPPLMGVKARLSECRRDLWVDTNYTFALRRDGTIYLWQANIFKEWAVMLLFMGTAGGGCLFFSAAVLIMLLLSLRDRLSHRANDEVRTYSATRTFSDAA